MSDLEVRDPDWLTRLRTALFADASMPETDEAYTPYSDGVQYICQRRLDYEGERLAFHETWLEPATYRVQKSWSQEIEAGAFVGVIPDDVFAQTVARLVQWLHQARPQPVTRTRPYAFSPGRFAQQGTQRKG